MFMLWYVTHAHLLFLITSDDEPSGPRGPAHWQIIVTVCAPPLLVNVIWNCWTGGLALPVSVTAFIVLCSKLPLPGEAVTPVGNVELICQESVPPPVFFTVSLLSHWPLAQNPVVCVGETLSVGTAAGVIVADGP